jgi:hypothetical protein
MVRFQRRKEELIQRWFFYNPLLQGIVWKKYYTPDAKVPEVSISARAQRHLDELRENGVTQIPGFETLADHLESTYFSVIDGRASKQDQSMEKVRLGDRDDVTNTQNYRVSFKDPGLAPLVLDRDISGILYNYYHRQPFFREQPWIIKNAQSADFSQDDLARLEISAKFHVDFYRQITMMLLVNDLTEADSHLEYAIGSHKLRNTWRRYSYDDEEIAKKFRIQHCVGARGTLIILDAGSGFHRGMHKKGTVRKTLQCLLTAGHYYPAPEQKMNVADWQALSSHPAHVRRMFEDLRLD